MSEPILIQKSFQIPTDPAKMEPVCMTPFVNATYDKSKVAGKRSWTIEIMCYLPISDSSKSEISLVPEEFMELYKELLPVKKININFRSSRMEAINLWYIKSVPFDLDEFYSIIEIQVDNDMGTGKIRGGKTVGMSNSLTNI
ncbi:hypothetical protein [Flavobacterium sp. '19STA2R22 D10 B1']|uniref:hypothetical protein n=1 Tax=Flavobacterium aerium TaxID=3037261 RepID=UPI00278BE952|nr:hypothetical protein [Flavobacterium sp. '19STA2R22 D10 B1']